MAVPELPMTVVNWPTATVVNASHLYESPAVDEAEFVLETPRQEMATVEGAAVGFYPPGFTPITSRERDGADRMHQFSARRAAPPARCLTAS